MPDEAKCPKMFPLQTHKGVTPGPVQIPWSIAEKAYGAYAALYGRGQSLERLAERGGFGWGEMDELYPPWREEVSEIVSLRADLARVTAERDAALDTAQKRLDSIQELHEKLGHREAELDLSNAECAAWRRLARLCDEFGLKDGTSIIEVTDPPDPPDPAKWIIDTLSDGDSSPEGEFDSPLAALRAIEGAKDA